MKNDIIEIYVNAMGAQKRDEFVLPGEAQGFIEKGNNQTGI